jgi:hypothetical protein
MRASQLQFRMGHCSYAVELVQAVVQAAVVQAAVVQAAVVQAAVVQAAVVQAMAATSCPFCLPI